MPLKEQTDFSSFLSLDIRLGKIIKVEMSQAKKPTYKITADFGDEIGEKVSVGAFTHYTEDKLIGLSIIGVINIGTMKMGPEVSEFLCLGVLDQDGNAIPLTPFEDKSKLGTEVF